MSTIQLKSGELTVTRDGQAMKLSVGDAVLFNDEVVNTGSSDAVVEIPALVGGQTPAVLTLQPEASARIVQKVDVATGIEQAEVVPTCQSGVSIENEDDELASGILNAGDGCGYVGLVGAGLLAAGVSPLAAAAVAAGVFVAVDDNNDSGGGTGGGSSGGGSGGGVPPTGPADSAGGLAGTVDGLSESVSQTPLAPVTTVLEPVADALTQAGGALNDVAANDPTGVVGVIAEVVGVSTPGGGSADQGLVGGVNSVASAVANGTEGTPLAPVGEALAPLVGSSNGSTSGLASGLGAIGTVLNNDSSPLAPVTSGLLGPVVGGEGTGAQGLPGTLNAVADGANALTATGPLAPLAPVTDALDQGLNALAGGLLTAGNTLDENSSADPTGTLDTVAELLGAPVEPKGPAAPGATNTSSGAAGTVADVGTALADTPLEPLTAATTPLANGLLTAGNAIGGFSDQDPTGVTSVLAGVLGSTGTQGSSESGLAGGVNALSDGLEAGAHDTPLGELITPVTETLGADNGAMNGVAQGLAAVGSVLSNDSSPLAPLTSGVLGPVVGGDNTGAQGLPETLHQVASGLNDLTATGPLNPLTPATDALAQGVNALADGLATAGATLDENKAADPTGTVDLLAELLGAPVEPKGATAPAATTGTTGLAGTLADVGHALEATPLAPATALTGPLADGALTAGNALAGFSEQDPTGLAALLGKTLGSNAAASSTDDGLVGGLNALATGLDKGAEGSPLADVVDPLSRTVGSDEGQTSGVALALSEIGGVLVGDSSPLAPLTSGLLGPVVGTHGNEHGGVVQTLEGVADGANALTATGPLAPLAPVTDGVAMVLDTAAGGLGTAADALAGNAGADPSGTLQLISDLLGGQATGGGAPSPTPNADGLAGALLDVGTALNKTPLSPLAAVTDALGSGLLAAGSALGDVAAQDPTGLATLLTHVLGTTDTQVSTDSGVVGVLNAIAAGLDAGTTGSPLEGLIDPVSELVGSQEGATNGVAAGVAALGTTLALDDSPLAPLTSGILSPVVGQSAGVESGLPSTLHQVALGLGDLTTDSVLAPLAPVTDALATVLDTVGGGLAQGGAAITDFSAQDPSGVAHLLGDLLGGGSGVGIASTSVDFSAFELPRLPANLPF
ncbi:MAG: beta strand repeat-containing protein [Limnobacter sp.]|uniref:beta strand repeat-containing protein n=1 Tax=Limnobacter sp. TaxID=2003368 RepID=UPI00391C102C